MKPSSNGVDVPVWEAGDTWTYNMEIYIASSPNVTDDMIVDAYGELTYEVVCDSGDIYTLNGNMKPIYGKVILPGNADLKATRFTSYESFIEVQKSDLSIVRHYSIMKGIVLITIGPITLPIPIQMQGDRLSEFDPAFNIMPFPLNDGDSGTLTNSTLHEETETSIFWGLILIEKADDIEWYTGHIDYTCNLESLTVEAGTYDVYNVTGHLSFGIDGHDWYRSYYAEEVGNVAKSVTHIEYSTEETYYNMELELKSTTYEP
jgi:hypothetical protein